MERRSLNATCNLLLSPIVLFSKLEASVVIRLLDNNVDIPRRRRLGSFSGLRLLFSISVAVQVEPGSVPEQPEAVCHSRA